MAVSCMYTHGYPPDSPIRPEPQLTRSVIVCMGCLELKEIGDQIEKPNLEELANGAVLVPHDTCYPLGIIEIRY